MSYNAALCQIFVTKSEKILRTEEDVKMPQMPFSSGRERRPRMKPEVHTPLPRHFAVLFDVALCLLNNSNVESTSRSRRCSKVEST